jgi:hypothetical protein
LCGAGDFPGSCQTKSASSLSLSSARPPGRCGSFCVEFVWLISLCACHLGPLAFGLRGGGGFTRLSVWGMRCLWHAPGGVWPAGASCNGFVTQWKGGNAHDLSHSSGLLAPAGRAAAQGCVRRCARQRGDHGSSRGTPAQSKPNCFCRVRSLPLGSNPPPPGGTCGWFLHVRTRGVLGYLFLPSRRAGGDAARPLAR